MARLWDFTTLIPAERRARLLEIEEFEEVLHKVISTTKILNYVAEPASDSRLKGCSRASFLLKVDPYAYDGFFNSPIGYRAQYCLGRDLGELANRQLLSALGSKLLAFAETNSTAEFGLEQIGASLDAFDAKIWIDEREPVSVPPTELEIHIDYPPWTERARRADRYQEEEYVRAIRGVRAPFGTKLEVKGGWLKGNGTEMRDPTKVRRGEEIAINGYI